MSAHPGIEYLSTLKPWTGNGEFGLTEITKVLVQLDNPHNKLKCLHIAGTNGKGSVCANISATLGAAGYKVGLTTSPHLSRVNERIVVDGQAIGDSELDSAALKIKSACQAAGVQLSFFEAITTCAFLVFHERGVDWAVIEVGLGGRLDATNVISSPVVSAIVSIDLDHQVMLGETIPKIAAEKAGIMKRGVPVVVGNLPAEASLIVSERARELSCPEIRFGFEYDYLKEERGAQLNLGGRSFHISPALKGKHQIHNACIAAAVCSLIGCKEEFIQAGLGGTVWPGRLEEIEFSGKKFLLDAGHNPAGIRALTTYLSENYDRKIGVVFGVLNTKNWAEMLKTLIPFASNWYIVEPQSESAVSSNLIVEYLSGNGIRAIEFGKDYEACLSRVFASDEKEFLMAGSIYMIGAMRAKISSNINRLWSRTV